VSIVDNLAYVADTSPGLRVVDISNPHNPQIIGSAYTGGHSFGVSVSGTYAYIADGASGFRVVDISNPANPQLVSGVMTPPDAMGIEISGTYAYVAVGGSGMVVIDIINPLSPQIISTVNTPGVSRRISVKGSYAYVADGYSLQVINIANPQHPIITSSVAMSGWAYDVAILGQYAYIATSMSGMSIVNITDPENLQVVGGVSEPIERDARGVYVSDTILCIANGIYGLQVLQPFCDTYLFDSPVVEDIPDDQGGQLLLSWSKHPLDIIGSSTQVIQYNVERFNSFWETLVSVEATQADNYNAICPTEDIITFCQPAPFSKYRIVAFTAVPGRLFTSLPDSGYSIDNIPPDVPNLTIYDSETYRFVSWQNPQVADFRETCVYRGETFGFVPGNPLLCGTGTFYQEPHLVWYAYKARSFDIHGNASEWSNEVVGQYPTGVPGAVPTVLRLYPNQPNPFNPQTTIKYDVPADGRATLRIYDVRGALIRTLIDADLPRGSHQATWDGRDASGRGMASGSYFARLEAGGRGETARLSLVR